MVVAYRIAREFNLYTKITGSQRIGLFGAQKDDLPEIWRQLIDAGFETGHAYAKALRMAKTCVGSTWCRYGVGDSVGFGVELENRYKGIRTPHKMKFGVSGCTRECAEAQGKDVGIIATEKGWNLYVCGNGGMKPRHADLLAADLDRETLMKYLDRFMMFYIRTADKLTRTAPWLDNLEGGIDYLKSVIIDDKLGLNEHLEEEMARLREAVVCEWTETVNTPAAQVRFKHFINSDKRDPNVQVVPEREQHRPYRALRTYPGNSGGGKRMSQWKNICKLDDILPETGVCALLGDKQVAIFRPYHGDQVFAISNIDPFFESSVLSRGLIAEHQGELWVASPLKKQRFRLRDGLCMEDESHSVAHYEARVKDGVVQLRG